jgi:hypothetical protein
LAIIAILLVSTDHLNEFEGDLFALVFVLVLEFAKELALFERKISPDDRLWHRDLALPTSGATHLLDIGDVDEAKVDMVDAERRVRVVDGTVLVSRHGKTAHAGNSNFVVTTSFLVDRDHNDLHGIKSDLEGQGAFDVFPIFVVYLWHVPILLGLGCRFN